MKKLTIRGRVVTPDEVIENGQITAIDGIITYVGEACDTDGELVEYKDKIIAPGFVDIHCHAGGEYWAYEDPVYVAKHHGAHGTTSLLCTFYRGETEEEYLRCFDAVTEAMKTEKNIKGVHMEGPYLNPYYGAASTGEGDTPDDGMYKSLADYGIVKQWTYAPEVEGTDEFLDYIVKKGIVPAIGHSAASPAQVEKAAKNGAKIVTHLFDATGCAVNPPRFDGTKEMDFSFATLLHDEFCYEIICDREYVHVRSDMIKLAHKIAGDDRIIAITDACTGDASTDYDINVVNGELDGSKLTMNKAAKNFYAIGFTLPQVFKFTSANPARVIGFEKTGKLEVGYYADIVVLDSDFEVEKVYLR